MNRRDFLKQAGIVAVAAPAAASNLAGAAGGVVNRSSIKDLRVTFDGPFCFWWQGDSVRVMAPPVGPNCPDKNLRHQPWLGTTTNETTIDVSASPGPNLSLEIPGYIAWPSYNTAGTTAFEYKQGTDSGAPPLFNLTVPAPYVVIGVRPTAAKMVCTPGVKDPYCTEWRIYASGLTFVYPIVDLTGVRVMNGSAACFTPCFTNDDSLPDATLGVHLTPLCRPDPGHVHATLVWQQMISMYPWMCKEITSINFCDDFDPASCNFDVTKCGAGPKRIRGGVLFGPGSDCQVPIMGLTPGDGGNKRRQ
jgi:hypothetical protein